MAGSTVTNIGPTVVNGDLGVSPGSAVTGFPPGIVNGTIHAGDAVAAQAQSDLTIAFNDAAGQACDVDLTGQDLGGLTLTAGRLLFRLVAQLNRSAALRCTGDPDAAFIFQIGNTLTTASGSSVELINGARACNVFFQVGSSATLGTDTTFVGNILALTSITLNTGATVDGRVLARNGVVTLDDNVITLDTCNAPAPTPTPTPVATPTPDATPTPTRVGTPVATRSPRRSRPRVRQPDPRWQQLPDGPPGPRRHPRQPSPADAHEEQAPPVVARMLHWLFETPERPREAGCREASGLSRCGVPRSASVIEQASGWPPVPRTPLTSSQAPGLDPRAKSAAEPLSE